MKRVTAILDTDTYNEVDDQFALAHLLLHDETIDLQAVHAAPFFNSRSSGPGDGMEKSYEEIQRMLELVGPKVPPAVYRGSTSYLPDARTPVESEAVRDLIERALAAKETLYVLTIGACTNVASAKRSRSSGSAATRRIGKIPASSISPRIRMPRASCSTVRPPWSSFPAFRWPPTSKPRSRSWRKNSRLSAGWAPISPTS